MPIFWWRPWELSVWSQLLLQACLSWWASGRASTPEETDRLQRKKPGKASTKALWLFSPNIGAKLKNLLCESISYLLNDVQRIWSLALYWAVNGICVAELQTDATLGSFWRAGEQGLLRQWRRDGDVRAQRDAPHASGCRNRRWCHRLRRWVGLVPLKSWTITMSCTYSSLCPSPLTPS